MNPPDLKKLVTSFLLLAIVVSSSSFLFLTALSQSAHEEVSARNVTSVPRNAFVEPITESSGTLIPSVGTSNNLTELLARRLAEQILKNNPEGPVALDGAPAIAGPDLDLLAGAFVADPTVMSPLVKDNVRLRIVDPPTVKMADNLSPEEISNYITAVERIGATLSNPRLEELTTEEFSSNALSAIEVTYRGASLELGEMTVPTELAEFHRSLLALTTYIGDVVSASSASDPLRSIATLEARYANLAAALDDFEMQAKEVGPKLETLLMAQGNHGFDGTLFAGIVGVRTAHAAIPVADVLNKIAHWVNMGSTVLQLAHTIFQWLRKLFTELLKDYLIQKLVNQTITWIQGGGKPQFITDWKGFLAGAANVAVGNKLYELEPRLCQSFGPLVKIAFLPVDPYAAGSPVVQCTLSQIIGNVEAFAESFENGGWVAYGAALKPSNNLFGSLIQVSDLMQREATSEAEGAESDAEAASGFLSTKVCVKEETRYQDAGSGPQPFKVCVAWENQTPGEVLGNAVYDALGAPIHRIVNAEDITALVSALINAALSKLVLLGSSGLNRGLAGVIIPKPDFDGSDHPCKSIPGLDLEPCLKALEGACVGLPEPDKTECIEAMCGIFKNNPQNYQKCVDAVLGQGSDDDCGEENCSPDCLCKCAHGISGADMCYVNLVDQAQNALVADFKAGMPNTGLTNVGCNGCNICAVSTDAYMAALAAKIESLDSSVQAAPRGDEIGVTGNCFKTVCSYTDDPGPGCFPGGSPREERFDVLIAPKNPGDLQCTWQNQNAICVPS